MLGPGSLCRPQFMFDQFTLGIEEEFQIVDPQTRELKSHVSEILDEGRLLLAGPCPAIDAEDPGPAGFSGSLVVAEFGSLEEARAWADADPYVDAGVYARVDVRPFKRVLP